jgi:hypothetical protein
MFETNALLFQFKLVARHFFKIIRDLRQNADVGRCGQLGCCDRVQLNFGIFLKLSQGVNHEQFLLITIIIILKHYGAEWKYGLFNLTYIFGREMIYQVQPISL